MAAPREETFTVVYALAALDRLRALSQAERDAVQREADALAIAASAIGAPSEGALSFSAAGQLVSCEVIFARQILRVTSVVSLSSGEAPRKTGTEEPSP